ncbi:MAG: hypothetical protein NTW28_34985 [Candidatus Solibacter sp.]|nr:hypothetical protein [Candidatus Solibacter sp.]
MEELEKHLPRTAVAVPAIRGKDRAAAQVWDDLMQQARGEKSKGVN